MTNKPDIETKEPTDYESLGSTFIILGFVFVIIGITTWALLPIGIVFIALGLYYQRVAKKQHDAKKRSDSFAAELDKATEKKD